MNLIRTLAIIFLVYYLLKFILKFFEPQIKNYAGRKMEEKFNQHFNNQGDRQSTEKEAVGKTSIVNKPSNSSKFKDDKEGDYIDFEELD